MQYTLSFVKDGKKYVSNVFDFETACLINDEHNSGRTKGPLSLCRSGVDHMFEGTEATQEVIDSLGANERTRLCLELWDFYIEAVSSKKASGAAEKKAEA